MFENPDPLGWQWVFILVALFAIVSVGYRVIRSFFPDADEAKERQQSEALARKISAVSQRVCKVRVEGKNIHLLLRSNDDEMYETHLFFPPKHPDFFIAHRLQRLQFVEFRFLERPIERIGDTDAVAYLRFKLYAEENQPPAA